MSREPGSASTGRRLCGASVVARRFFTTAESLGLVGAGAGLGLLGSMTALIVFGIGVMAAIHDFAANKRWLKTGHTRSITHMATGTMFTIQRFSRVNFLRLFRLKGYRGQEYGAVNPRFFFTGFCNGLGLFNHFFLAPVLNTLVVLVCLPVLLIVVFDRSERSMRSAKGRCSLG